MDDATQFRAIAYTVAHAMTLIAAYAATGRSWWQALVLVGIALAITMGTKAVAPVPGRARAKARTRWAQVSAI